MTWNKCKKLRQVSGNANQDLEVLKDALEDGATKLGSYLRDFLR